MRYWYGYTGERLIVGHGRTIRQLVPQSSAVQELREAARAHYANYAATTARRPAIAEATFTAAMLAPLAVRAFGVASPPATVFSSAGQLLRLFDGQHVEQVAVNLFNGRVASAYADAGDIAARVAQGFDDGDLLFLPRDAARLYAPETLSALPGALVFLLSRFDAERKAFSQYLRRGAPPVLSADTRRALAKSRPVLRTWEREARLLNEGVHS